MSQTNKKSPLESQRKRKIGFGNDKANFRAVTEEADGKQVRHIRGYAILYDIPGSPYRGSAWKEKIDKKALESVDFSKLVLLLDHRTEWVLGRVGKNMTATVDDTGLFIDVILGNTWLDDYAYDRVAREIIDGMSFWFDSAAAIAVDWTNKLEVVTKINEVYEVSIVVFPVYEETVAIASTSDPQEEETPAGNEQEAGEEKRRAALAKLIQNL